MFKSSLSFTTHIILLLPYAMTCRVDLTCFLLRLMKPRLSSSQCSIVPKSRQLGRICQLAALFAYCWQCGTAIAAKSDQDPSTECDSKSTARRAGSHQTRTLLRDAVEGRLSNGPAQTAEGIHRDKPRGGSIRPAIGWMATRLADPAWHRDDEAGTF